MSMNPPNNNEVHIAPSAKVLSSLDFDMLYAVSFSD